MTSSLKLFWILYYIKQIDSKLPCVCSVIDHRGRQNVVRTSVTHLTASCMPLCCSYHILTSSVIYCWTDAQQLGIYLLIRCLFRNAEMSHDWLFFLKVCYDILVYLIWDRTILQRSRACPPNKPKIEFRNCWNSKFCFGTLIKISVCRA